MALLALFFVFSCGDSNERELGRAKIGEMNSLPFSTNQPSLPELCAISSVVRSKSRRAQRWGVYCGDRA
jgi:hypothetical protein